MKLFFFDTETTGLNYDDQILQFGGIFGTFDGEKFHEERRINQFINVSKEISPEAERIHGISKNKVKDFGYIEEYIDELLLYIKKADYIIGHNLDFDIKMLKQECDRIGYNFDRDNVKSFCTMKETIDILNLPGKKWPKLSELYYYLFNKYFDNTHDAISDIEATKDCFIELVKRNLVKDFKENFLDNTQKLINAASNGDQETIETLIESGIDINTPLKVNEEGFHKEEFALIRAISNGHKDIVKMLIRSGADITIEEKGYNDMCGGRKNTTLTSAAAKGYKDIVEILINAGANVNVKERHYGVIDSENTALGEASTHGYKDIVEVLINAGANVNLQDERGKTALINAITYGQKDIVKILINAGANVDLQDKRGKTALGEAIRSGYKDIVEILINAGANVNVKERHYGVIDSENTALGEAIRSGYKDIVEILINAGANVNSKSNNNETALTLATRFGHKEIIDILINKGANF